jgi:hypothetical protein
MELSTEENTLGENKKWKTNVLNLGFACHNVLKYYRPIAPAPNDECGAIGGVIFQRKPKYSEKTCPSSALSTTNPTWPALGSDPGRRCGKRATNRLSYGASRNLQFGHFGRLCSRLERLALRVHAARVPCKAAVLYKQKQNKLRGLSPLANCTDRATAACRRRGCHVVGVTDSYGRILGFLYRSRYFFFQVAPQLHSRRGRVDPVPDPLLLR